MSFNLAIFFSCRVEEKFSGRLKQKVVINKHYTKMWFNCSILNTGNINLSGIQLAGVFTVSISRHTYRFTFSNAVETLYT